MRQPVRGNKKKAEQPVIVTWDTKFKPKVSERTLKKRQEDKENRLNPGRYASGLDLCGVICLYGFLVLAVLIGGGGIGVCAYYYNDSTTQGWKIGGIVMGAITCIIGVILILLTIFKQARNRPWRYKKKEKIIGDDGYLDEDDDDDDQMSTEDFDGKPTRKSVVIINHESFEERRSAAGSPDVHSVTDEKTRETASSPMHHIPSEHSQLKTLTSDLIFCPGCNRTHPSAHQCMYSTRLANGFAAHLPTISRPTQQDSVAIQTDDDGRKKKKTGPHTVIDRQLKYSNTTETQTNVTANPRSNITESVILRRVPIPTAKVVVQQPTTKVMIVKVPNIPGQLVIQPKTGTTGEQPK